MAGPFRVLMVTQFYAPVVGGQERAVENLSVALARAGHYVAVATLAHPEAPRNDCRDGVQVHRVGGTLQRVERLFRDPERRHCPPAPDPETARHLARVIEQERPDVVHAHDWMVHSLRRIPAIRRRELPLVLSLHDHSLVCATKRLMRGNEVCSGPELAKCLGCGARQYGPAKGAAVVLGLRSGKQGLFSSVQRFLPVSQSVARQAGLEATDVPFEVLPNLVPERVSTVGETSDLPEPGFLAFAGDATVDKGIDTLLDAHELLGSEPSLVVIGRPSSPRLADAPPNVLVLGPRPHAYILEAWRRCAVAVSPSICLETFGLSALEAMAMGRPVVASRRGGLEELVQHGVTGILTAPGDPVDLAGALSRLLSDGDLRTRMGRAARRRAEAFGERVIVARLERLYAEVITNVPRTGPSPSESGIR